MTEIKVLGIDMTDNETETFCDQRPGRFNLVGQNKPDDLVAAECSNEMRWVRFHNTVSSYEDGEATLEDVNQELAAAKESEAALVVEQERWHKGTK